jgi:hypothetical protein
MRDLICWLYWHVVFPVLGAWNWDGRYDWD